MRVSERLTFRTLTQYPTTRLKYIPDRALIFSLIQENVLQYNRIYSKKTSVLIELLKSYKNTRNGADDRT